MTAFELFFILAGPFIGSFIGLLAFRWPEGEPWVAKRSSCRSCRTELGWTELVPVFSWLLRRGKCKSCGVAITPFYAICEVIALIIPICAFFLAGAHLFVLTCLMGWTLLALAAIDWRSFILPDPLNLLLVLLGAVMVWATAREAWIDHLIGAVAGYVLLLSVELFYKFYRGRDGLGRPCS